jgi:hypothetical protein
MWVAVNKDTMLPVVYEATGNIVTYDTKEDAKLANPDCIILFTNDIH